MLQPKDYQRRCLDDLAAYLRRVMALGRADVAFYEKTGRPFNDVAKLHGRDLEQLRGLPYVCLRVPTGGGKTFMAAHAVAIACKEFLRRDTCLALWLAPTTQIVDQTLGALRDKRHPYRQALDEAFGGCVTVMDLGAALGMGRAALEADTVIIVSTMAALRVENTEGRKIYEANGHLLGCFDDLAKEQLKRLGKVGDFDPTVPCLANLLRLYRPVVIVDEAHNARTHLSFDTLARFSPSCILELTATPEQDPKGDPSNVLSHVSAAELKDEDMIKLPIMVKCRPQWKEAVQEAIVRQAELEKLAREEEKRTGEYVRPIVLFQAQHKGGRESITYEVLKDSLRQDFNVPEDQILIATGEKNELADRDVLSRTEPVRYIITVDKLREGWDCPFAYILCTVSNLTKSRAVEQILGRILRLPHARRKGAEELNRAYAYASAQGFVEAAEALTEALVESGFEKFEAKAMVRPEPGALPLEGTLFERPVSEAVTAPPRMESLPKSLAERLTVKTEEGRVELVYEGAPLSDAEAGALKDAFAEPADKQAVERLCRRSRGESVSPASLGRRFSVPLLAVRDGDQLDMFEDQFRDIPWHLSECDPRLSEKEFAGKPPDKGAAKVDVDKEGRIGYEFVEELERGLTLLERHGPTTETELAFWLDRRIEHPDITHADAGLYLRRLVDSLVRERGFGLEQLVGQRFRLRDAVKEKINALRQAALNEAYQRMLLPGAATPIEVSPEVCFTFPINVYPADTFYRGAFHPRKHYYDNMADMNGEEAECAAVIDALPEVEHWVRNLERGAYAFWLQMPTGKFYPDFVARLNDGRYLVVEYKGGHLYTDAEAKRQVGELWEARSNSRCLFVMPTKKQYDGIAAKVRRR